MQTTRLDQASRSLQLDTTVKSKPGSSGGLKECVSRCAPACVARYLPPFLPKWCQEVIPAVRDVGPRIKVYVPQPELTHGTDASHYPHSTIMGAPLPKSMCRAT